ncbi:Protein hedgehog [Seminavis robusta]|uniref:Protein hedgehog n=1 Tax=Seminavis robusta TaxID=568900 RepID=A0A9N8DZI3_9STRA|nr:Protein hedgehog [Seminavis robusta]|eukprot:Sro400_g135160.1 Protein hedgehog (381) ;mRNA; r:46780-48084
MSSLQSFSFYLWFLVLPVKGADRALGSSHQQFLRAMDLVAGAQTEQRRLSHSRDSDDDFFSTIKPCEDKSCNDDNDCYDVYICFKREKGDPIPKCCDNRDYETDNSRNYCAVKSCDTGGGGGGLCFSGETKVHVFGGKTVSMKDLQVGDHILTSNSQGEMIYQKVYAFAHRHHSRPTQFLQIQTNTINEEEDDTAESPILEVTREHMVFVEGKSKPIRADTIQVGDNLLGIISNQQHVVTTIAPVVRKGMYAPLTHSGMVVVANGIVASNYIAMQPKQTNGDGYVSLPNIGSVAFLHQADVAHMWLSPFRIFCGALEVCHRVNVDGLLHYASWGLQLVHFMEQQPLWAQLLVLIPPSGGLAWFWCIKKVVFQIQTKWKHN